MMSSGFGPASIHRSQAAMSPASAWLPVLALVFHPRGVVRLNCADDVRQMVEVDPGLTVIGANDTLDAVGKSFQARVSAEQPRGGLVVVVAAARRRRCWGRAAAGHESSSCSPALRPRPVARLASLTRTLGWALVVREDCLDQCA
jgi:hypothetical protein